MLKKILAVVAFASLSACALFAKEQTGTVEALPSPSLEKIADNVWIHKSYRIVEPWGPVLSQGMVVKTDAGIILVDTAWTNEETETLLNLIDEGLGPWLAMAVVTHAHSDKMGGMGELNKAGIPVFMHEWTKEDAPARGLQISESPASKTFFSEGKMQRAEIRLNTTVTKKIITTDKRVIDSLNEDGFREGKQELQSKISIMYPGPGHTRDNIVVYYAPAKVLFGGCLIRPGVSDNLGNTADGDVDHWAEAVRNVAEAFPDAEIVIPSHGPMGGRELLDHTIQLAEQAAAAQ